MPKDRTKQLVFYSPELGDRVCEHVLDGLSPEKIGRMPGMPSKRSIFYWLRDHEDFRRKYEIARMLKAEEWAHEIIEIADDTSGDWVITEAGERVVDHDHISRVRERISARKWLMSKLYPQRYGDRVVADITVRGDVKELSNQELLAIAGGGDAGAGEIEGDSDTVH
jgi:Bacteriophage Sf6, terminase small subunit-like